MSSYSDITGAVEATSVFSNSKRVGKNMTVQFPDVPFATQDLKALGTISIPIIPQIDSMELTITKSGLDTNYAELSRIESQEIEVRWLQSALRNDTKIGNIYSVGYFNAIPKVIPGPSIEGATISEMDFVFEVLRMRVLIGQEEVILVDKLNDIVVINGVDYTADLRSLL